MARLARVVVPGHPHHLTQRGNRRLPTFFSDHDYQAYLDLMAEHCREHRVAVRAWCLMPNHVHLVLVPQAADGLARAVGEAHRRYTRLVNFREGWRGHLWQERFFSCVLDGRHALAAVRYVERNPVRAGLVRRAWEWPWSSAAAHVSGRGDTLIRTGGPLAAEVSNWRRFLSEEDDPETLHLLRRHGRTGRPIDARTRRPINDSMPWWSLPETMLSTWLAYEWTGKEELLEWYRLAHNAYFLMYLNPRTQWAPYQTLDGRTGAAVDVAPACKFQDPEYHSGRNLLTLAGRIGKRLAATGRNIEWRAK